MAINAANRGSSQIKVPRKSDGKANKPKKTPNSCNNFIFAEQ